MGKCKCKGFLSDISELNRAQPTGPPFYIPVHAWIALSVQGETRGPHLAVTHPSTLTSPNVAEIT